jgi:Ca-activated chloride channel homolog
LKAITVILILLAMLTDPAKIGKINALKQEAKNAYLKGDFKTAISKYRYLVDSLHVQEDEIALNLAHAYFSLNDTTHAKHEYQSLTRSNKNHIRSKAQQQLGVLSNRQGKLEEALTSFKEALKSNPSNEDARYNYELVKKKLDEQKKQQQQNKDQNKDQKEQNKDQQKQDQKDKQNQDQQKQDQQKKDEQNKDQQQKDQQQKQQEEKQKQEQEKKEQDKKEQQKQEQEQEQQEKKENKKDIPPSVSEKLQQMQMSEEKAKMILEAMKNQEIQYLQQNKRKATKPKDKGKPDW